MNIANLFKMDDSPLVLRTGESLFLQGEVGNAMYILLEGTLAVIIGDEVVEVAERGAILGEMALIDQSPRSATVIARSRCLVAEVTPTRFSFLVSQTPNFALQVMKTMSERLRRMDGRIGFSNPMPTRDTDRGVAVQ